jgi:hypothetical protein
MRKRAACDLSYKTMRFNEEALFIYGQPFQGGLNAKFRMD